MHEMIDSAPSVRSTFATPDVSVELAPNVSLIARVVDPQRFQSPLGVDAFTVGIHQIAFQSADHDPSELSFTWKHVSREALIIKEFKQRGEGLRVAVVWSGSQEELVLEVRRDQSDEPCPEAFDSIAADCRRDVVGFVDNKKVEFPRMAQLGRQGIAHQTQTFALLGPVH